jgi:hypothetical protein
MTFTRQANDTIRSKLLKKFRLECSCLSVSRACLSAIDLGPSLSYHDSKIQMRTKNTPRTRGRRANVVAALRKVLVGSIAIAPFCLAPAAQAVDYVWDRGGGDSNWAVPGNWNPDGSPGALDTVTFSNTTTGIFGTIELGSTSQAISVINFTANTASSHTINGTAGVSLTGLTQINQTADDPNIINQTVNLMTANSGADVLTSNVTSNTLWLQGQLTSGGLVKNGGTVLRLGTNTNATNGAIAGDIVINGGTLQFYAGNDVSINNPMASSGAAGTIGTVNAGDDIIIGAGGVTLSTYHSNLAAAGSAGTYDWQRNIIANNNNFTWFADRTTGSATSGTAQAGTITIGTATIRTDTGNAFNLRTDGLIINPGATTTVQTDDLFVVDNITADASSKLIKTGTSELRIMSAPANTNATSFQGDIDLNQGTLTLFSNATGEEPLGNANTVITIGHPTNNPALSLRATEARTFANTNIVAGNNNFQLNVQNSSGTTNGFTMTVPSVSIGNATLTVNGDRANARITDLNLDAASTLTTLNVGNATNGAQSLRIDNLNGIAGNVLRKTGGQTVFISTQTPDYTGAIEVGGGTLQVENDAANNVNPLSSASRITFVGGSTLSLRADANYTFTTPINFDAATLSSTINVDRVGTTATGQRITVGKLDLSQTSASPKTLSTSAANTYTLATSEIAVDTGSAFLSTGTDTFTPKLSVAAGATFIKTGGSTLTLNGSQTASILGAVEVRGGTFTGTGAGYMGSQGILVGSTVATTAGFNNDTARLRFAVVGASGSTGPGATATMGGVIDLDVTPTATDKFAVLAHGRIQGSTAQLGALTVGTNLTLANDSIIIHDNAATAGNTVGGLTNNMSLYYGLGNNPTSLPAIGVGTPWKGISGDVATRTIQGSNTTTPALMNINGGDNDNTTVEAYLQAMANVNLNIGNAASLTDATMNFVSTVTGNKVTLGIRGYVGTTAVGLGKGGTVAFNDPASLTKINDAVDKIIVEGSMLTLTAAQSLGGVPVEVVGNGVLDIANAAGNYLDGNVVIKDGGALVLNDNQQTDGTGSITISTGGKLDIAGNPRVNVLTGGGGTQGITFAGDGNNTVRFSADNITGLDAAVPNAGATWVVSGGAATTVANFGTSSLTISVNTQTGLSTDGGVITNDATSRGLSAPLTIGPNGATFAATRNTNFVIANAVSTTGNVQIGSSTPIDGRDKSSNSTVLNSIGIQDPYNSSANVFFGSDFFAKNAVIQNSNAYFLDPDTSIQESLSITNGVLYLDGGGSIQSGTTGQLTTRLRDGNLAGSGITLGVNSRTEMRLDSPSSGRLDIATPFVIDGEVNPLDNRRLYVSRNSGSAALGVNFNYVTMNAGSALSIDEDNTDVRMSVTLKGDASIFVGNANDATDIIHLVRDSSAPANVTLTAGRINQTTGIQNFSTGTTSVWGTIGAGVDVNIIRSTYQLMPSSTLDGNIFTQNAPLGGDAYVISTSNGATDDTMIGGAGRIELGRNAASTAPREFEIRGTEIGTGLAPLHTHSGLIRVVNDGNSTNLDAIIRSNRVNDSTVTARTAITNVQVASGAGVQYTTLNGIPLQVDTTTLQGDGTIDVAGPGVTLTTINAGTNSVVLQGANVPTISGMITAGNLTINGFTLNVPLTNISGGLTAGTNPGGTTSSGTAGTAANISTTGNINGGLTINSSTVNMNANSGTSTVAGPVTLNNGFLNVSNGTMDAGTNMITGSGSIVVAGLRENRTPGNFDTTSPNLSATVRLGLTQANLTTGWGLNETYTYTGEFFVPNNNGDGTGTVAFAENFDDSVRLIFDGVQVLNNGVYNDATGTGAITKPTGWYTFEARFGQGTGGAGPVNSDGWDGTLGFGVDLTTPIDSSTGSPVRASYVAPVDNGSMNMFRTTLGSTINVAAGSGVKAGGMTNVTDLNLNGSGTLVQLVANSAPTASSVGNINVVTGANGAVQVDEAGDQLTVARLVLNGPLNLSGAGGLIVTGTGSGTGAVTSTIGKLINNGSILGTTDVSAGIVGGSGTFAVLNVTGNSTLSPGNSPGTLTTGNLSLEATTISLFELTGGNTTVGGGINDLVVVNGDLNLNGTLQVVGAGVLNGTYVLFDYSGNLTGSGLTIDPAFLAANPSAVVSVDSANSQVLLTLTNAIPEPSTIVLGSLFGLGLAVHGIRRRRLLAK